MTGKDLADRHPSLDGWRGVSILLVLIYHATQTVDFPSEFRSVARWMPDGRFGVEIFFVLSGFLITTLLLRESQSTGGLSLGRFLARRSLRIVPAYFVFLFALAALQSTTALHFTGEQWFRLATWTSNYGSMPWPAGHIWTLSVEQQFYLVWPLVLLRVLGQRDPLPGLILTCAIPIAICPLIRVASYVGVEGLLVHPYSFLACSDSLAWGCLLGGVYVYRRGALDHFLDRNGRFTAIIAATLIITALVLTRLLMLGVLTVPFGPTANAIGISALIILSLRHAGHPAFAWLGFAPLRALGLWSYSIYLWQQLFCSNPQFFGLDLAPWYMSFPGWIAGAVCTGIASHYLVERPFLRLRAHLPGTRGPVRRGPKS